MAEMPLFIYVHGVGNKLAPDEEKRKWDVDLFTEDVGDRSRLVYWADFLYKEPMPSRRLQLLDYSDLTTLLGDPSFEAATTSEEGRAFQGELLLEYVSYAGRRDAILADEDRRELLGPLGDLILPWILRVFVKDAYEYFCGPKRDAIRGRLRDTLQGVEEPIVVIGHSLGGIITFEILSEPGFSDLNVLHYITMGTQLGVAEIQRRLEPPLRAPGNVGAWTNFFDPWDPSPMAQTFADEFDHPSIALSDVKVDNLSDNNHMSGGYLRTPEVRRLVAEIVGRPIP